MLSMAILSVMCILRLLKLLLLLDGMKLNNEDVLSDRITQND